MLFRLQFAFSSVDSILETVYNLKLPTFMGNEGHEGSERWLEHVEKTFQVIQSQGSLPAER